MVDAYDKYNEENSTEIEVMFSIINESSMSIWIEQFSFVHTMEPQPLFVHRKLILPCPSNINSDVSNFYYSVTKGEGNREIMHRIYFTCCI